MRTCAFCNAEFEWIRQPGQRGRTKIFCSSSCSSKSRPRPPRKRTAPYATPAERAAASRKGAQVRWANTPPEARSEAMRHAARARFTPEQLERVAARVADRAARAAAPCPYCGEAVGRAGRKTCVKRECQLAHKADRMRGLLAERRAKKRGATVERVDPRAVFDRDGWICGICDEPVDPALRFPDPQSVSLDHIDPISLGGAHSYANTRCSHFGCNAARGNRVA